MNQPIVAQLSTKLSTGQLFIITAQESIKNSLAIFLDGAYQCGILLTGQENTATCQIKLFFNAGFSNLIEKIWLAQGSSDEWQFQGTNGLIHNSDSRHHDHPTMFHVELA